ncbi:MAG: acetate--CoA ligase family protein, partial [Candidatus Nanopelagicales bacterium]
GRTGFFCQSGALGSSILDLAARRGVGTSTFVSAGNRSDVSGNDLMQYWEDDPATDVVLLYLESIGNPRKFTRIARRLSRRKPVVAIRSGRSTQAFPLGHRVRRSTLPREALDALFSQSGVIQTATLAQMLDIAVLLEHQPLPNGPRVAVVGNSDALAVLATDAIEAESMVLAGSPVALRGDGSSAAFAAALAAVVDDPSPDSLLVLHVPPFDVEREAFLGQILAVADRSSRPVVAVLGGGGTHRGLLRGEHAVVPTFDTVEDAVKAMAAVHGYARWLASPEGVVPELGDVRRADAHVVVDRLIARLPTPDPGAELNVSALDGGDLVELLAAFGIVVRPAMSVTTAAQAVAAARGFGYPVALTARDPKDRHRADGVGVRLDLGNDRAVRTAWRALRGELGSATGVEHSVQAMASRGVEARIASAEDALFGPVVSLAVGGDVVQLLGDRAYRIPPLTDADAHALLTSPRAAPLLSRVAPDGLLALEELLIRVGQLAETCPELASLVLDPVLVTPEGPVVLAARALVRRPRSRTDGEARRLR